MAQAFGSSPTADPTPSQPPSAFRMAPKRKSAKAAAAEPAAKEAKTEQPSKEKEEKPEPKEDPPAETEAAKEEPKEKEQDDKKDARAAIKEPVGFHGADTTLNVVPTNGGNVLMSLTDGGMQFLIAGARANVGVKSGRYFFEVKVIEALTPQEGWNQGRSRVPVPRQLVRVGFSVANSSLILGDGGEGCVCFDSEGYFYADKKRTPSSTRFGREQSLGVLLNLDAKSPNANTVSLFCNGARISEPQPLPEKLQGQPLFPHVSYRNVSLHVNFGSQPMSALPFKCRMLQEAAAADVKETKAEKPKDGKYEVLFPVAFPDEGTFEWLDGFLEKHPNYTELSDRMVLDWAEKSGIWRQKGYKAKTSNDKPETGFNIRELDDGSVRRVLHTMAPLQARNFVVMELKGNLTKTERSETAGHFPSSSFKKTAQVIVGEPTADFKKKTHEQVLKQKQEQSDAEFRAKKAEAKRKKIIAQKQKKLEKEKRRAEKLAKKKQEALRKKIEEDKRKKEQAEKGEANKDEEEAKKEEDAKEKEKEEEDKSSEEEEEEKEEEEETVDFENVDVFGINDILNIGANTPLFKDFQFEDWTMMSLRFELHLLAHAFRHDVEDTERAGIHLDHLAFYYNKYYKKALSTKYYGLETFKELVDLVTDSVYVTKKQVIESQLDAEMECLQIFAKLTEEARRYRQLRLALGEESARLKLSSQPMQFAPGQQGQMQRGGKRGPKGGWYGDGTKGSKGGKSFGGGGGGGFQQGGSFPQHYQPPRQQSVPAPRTVAPRTVRPPTYRQSWNDSKGKGK
uniref:B30.2/SPRY domain-containing protein n=2 Tax=Alexandrium catenella TaxID=2925 RepID=A0A7S1WDV0_ALECA